MDATDTALETIVREWVASHGSSLVDLVIRPEARGGPASFRLEPINSLAATATLWVADDGKSVSFSIGDGAWWDGGVPLEVEAVTRVLNAVAAGEVDVQVRRLFGRVVALRGSLGRPGVNRFTYGQINPFSVLPGLVWESIAYQPYSIAEKSDA